MSARTRIKEAAPTPLHIFPAERRTDSKLNEKTASDLGLALSGKKTRGRQGVNFEEVKREGFGEEAVARERKVEPTHKAACPYKVGAVVSSGAAGSWAACVWGGGRWGQSPRATVGRKWWGAGGESREWLGKKGWGT